MSGNIKENSVLDLDNLFDSLPYSGDKFSQALVVSSTVLAVSSVFIGLKTSLVSMVIFGASVSAYNYYEHGQVPEVVSDAGAFAHDWIYEPVTNWLAEQSTADESDQAHHDL